MCNVQQPILVVDDSMNDLLLIESALLSAGVTNPIVCKLSVTEASKYLNGSAINPGQRPAVLMTDLKMPGMDGIDLVRWAKNQWGLEDILAVVLSGSELGDDVARAYDAGANIFLTKPEQFLDQVKMFQGLMGWLKAA
jgi:CheY-like chemotaxis protein